MSNVQSWSSDKNTDRAMYELRKLLAEKCTLEKLRDEIKVQLLLVKHEQNYVTDLINSIGRTPDLQCDDTGLQIDDKLVEDDEDLEI